MRTKKRIGFHGEATNYVQNRQNAQKTDTVLIHLKNYTFQNATFARMLAARLFFRIAETLATQEF